MATYVERTARGYTLRPAPLAYFVNVFMLEVKQRIKSVLGLAHCISFGESVAYLAFHHTSMFYTYESFQFSCNVAINDCAQFNCRA